MALLVAVGSACGTPGVLESSAPDGDSPTAVEIAETVEGRFISGTLLTYFRLDSVNEQSIESAVPEFDGLRDPNGTADLSGPYVALYRPALIGDDASSDVVRIDSWADLRCHSAQRHLSVGASGIEALADVEDAEYSDGVLAFDESPICPDLFELFEDVLPMGQIDEVQVTSDGLAMKINGNDLSFVFDPTAGP